MGLIKSLKKEKQDKDSMIKMLYENYDSLYNAYHTLYKSYSKLWDHYLEVYNAYFQLADAPNLAESPFKESMCSPVEHKDDGVSSSLGG